MMRQLLALNVCVLFAQSLLAADVEVRFIAADKATPIPVSDLVNFRRSPDGGLMAVQWLSGVRIDDKPIFPIRSEGIAIPDAPNVASTTHQDTSVSVTITRAIPDAPNVASTTKTATDDLDDLLSEINKKKPKARRLRPVDVVDEQYRDAKLSDGRKIGPTRFRSSVARVPVNRSSQLSPGALTTAKDGKIDVTCYPVTITAVRAGTNERDAFVPTLTFEGRDLLADCLFEHSPDMPLGDESAVARGAAEGQLGWLNATRGGKRDFRRLTIYLPANRDGAAYRLNGSKFRVTTKGVLVETPESERRETVTRRGKLQLQIVLPAESPATLLPIVSSLSGGWQFAQTHITLNEQTQRLAPITLSSGDKTTSISLHLPSGDANGHRFVQLIGDADHDPVARVIELPRGVDTNARRLVVRITQADARGEVDVPKAFTADLIPDVGLVGKMNSVRGITGDAKSHAETLTIKLERSGADTWTSEELRVDPGMYGLRLLIGDVGYASSLPPESDTKRPENQGNTDSQAGSLRHDVIPVVIANQCHGSVSLATYHNRNDYFRGEAVHFGVLTRGATEVADVPLFVKLRHAQTGEEHIAAKVIATCPANSARSQFVTLDSSVLRLGRYIVTIDNQDVPDHRLITYDTSFTVHASKPKSNFAVYSWFADSFSGPMKTRDKVLVNVLLSQKPTAPLTPDELQHLTKQPTFAANLQDTFASDPLYPAPQTTVGYDKDTEREMAVAMRLGIKYAPDYGWGMNGQEAAWNPKHTLPEELKRMQRLVSLVTQRHRDFGNFAGLHLNWYPRLNGNWEQHPATDGNAVPRRELLQKEVEAIYAETDEDKASPTGGFERSVRAHKYRVGAFARAYDVWTNRARIMTPGMHDQPESLLDFLLGQAFGRMLDGDMPGLDGGPVYTSFPPISWFQQRNYYPSAYHAKLPVASVHAYTDYGFSPLQPLWGVDHWAAGVGDKPVWATTMSNGRDIMLRQALLLAGRGADGIDIKGQDDRAAAVISDFLQSYGPFFRTLQPKSDVAIITSLRQQFSSKDLIGQWMGYTGGKYFDLYTKLWYARRPPAMLPEEDVTPYQLEKYSAVFVLGQKVAFPKRTQETLNEYLKQGGRIFKDADTSKDIPGREFSLLPTPVADGNRPIWNPKKYVQTRDAMFVGTHAGYEAVEASLDKLLSELPPPRVYAPESNILLATLEQRVTPLPHILGTRRAVTGSKHRGSNKARVVAAIFAANDERTPPGIEHPWNFWSATILSSRSKLTFDKPYVLYDLLEGGRELRLIPDGDRFSLPVEFDRCAGRAYIATTSPIRQLHVSVDTDVTNSTDVSVEVMDHEGATFADALPFEFSMLNEFGEEVQRIYRALKPAMKITMPLPSTAKTSAWSIQVRELASGITVVAPIRKLQSVPRTAEAQAAFVPRPTSVSHFMSNLRDNVRPLGSTEAVPSLDVSEANHGVSPLMRQMGFPRSPVLVVLDQRQLDVHGKAIRQLADQVVAALRKAGRQAEFKVIDADEVVEVSQRWRPTTLDRKYIEEAKAAKRFIAAGHLGTKHFPGNNGGAGALDVLHPASGWTEPSAVHRIYHDVIVLGAVPEHRLLADLHKTVGIRASDDFPAQGSALVQVTHDAFTPDNDCLSIQAHDLAGMTAGVQAVIELARSEFESTENGEEASVTAKPVRVLAKSSRDRTPLPNPIQDVFGGDVHAMAFTSDGGLIASAGTQAANYFALDRDGKLQRKWLGKYALEAESITKDGMWIHTWWGAPGFVDTVVRADQDAQPKWLMRTPRYSRSYSGWRHPGRRSIFDPTSGDLFVSGHNRLSRIKPDGTVVWQYDDLDTANDVDAFRFSRDIMLHGVSQDGRFMLAAAFGIEPYANIVAKFIRPTVMLFDARTGKIVWQKRDVLIDHSACEFVSGDRIVMADATPGRKRVMLLDLDGNEVWSQARPGGTSEAKLTPDGHWLIVRPEAPRGVNLRTLGPAKGLFVISVGRTSKSVPKASTDLEVRRTATREFVLSADLHAWRMIRSTGRVLVSTVDGWLRCYEPDTTLVWEHRFNGAVSVLTSSSGKDIAVGTRNGLLLRLDVDGKVTQHIDLMPHNMVDDREKYVRDYTASPEDAPVLDSSPKRPARIHERHGKVVQFSKNLLPAEQSLSIAVTKTWNVANAKPGTYILSVLQRSKDGAQTSSTDSFTIEIRSGRPQGVLYTVPVLMSSTWQERTVSWKLATAGNMSVTLKRGNGVEVNLRESALFTVRYPSPNLLVQRIPDAPGGLPDSTGGLGDLDSLLDGGGKQNIEPPTVRFYLPNDVDLAARSRGAPPFRAAIPYTVPFDGKLTGQKTSWLNRPVTGSTQAQLQLKFDKPTRLSALAIYEDSAAGFTDTFALFCRDDRTKQWRKLGHVRGNQNPFNLFTFATVETNEIVYLWLKSADRHARIAEMEGFRQSDLLEP